MSKNMDQELYNESRQWLRLAQGSGSAFTEIYNRYVTQVYSQVLKMLKDETTAEEITQEIFMHLWLKRESLQIETSFSAYLFTMSQRKVFDYFKKMYRSGQLYARYKEHVCASYVHIEEDLQCRETEEELKRALEKLSPQVRRAYELCKLEGMSYKQASEYLGLSAYTIKEYMVKANKIVRDHLSRHLQGIVLILLFLYFF